MTEVFNDCALVLRVVNLGYSRLKVLEEKRGERGHHNDSRGESVCLPAVKSNSILLLRTSLLSL